MKKRNRSIIQKDMSCCFVCGSTRMLQTHEIYFGTANRQKSIDWGCYVKLCSRHHNGSDAGVHYNKQLNLNLKQLCQRKFEELHGREMFMQTFRRNYLDGDVNE